MRSVRSLTLFGATLALAVPSIGSLGAQAPKSRRVASAQSAPAAAPTLNPLARRIAIDVRGVSLAAALREIGTVAGVRIVFSEDVERTSRSVTLVKSDITVGDAIGEALSGTPLKVTVSETGQLIVAAPKMQAMGIVIGKVTNGKTKQPVSGATILVDDATKGVVTDQDGSFRINVPAGEHTIHVRGIGFTRYSVRVTVMENQSQSLAVALEPTTSVLSEVIVTGTVVATERKAIPTPITVITAKDIEQRGITRVDQLFRGEIPGLIALDLGAAKYNDNYLGTMSSSRIYSRGSASLSGAANPIKTFVDGVELLDPSYIGTIDPNSIERIEVITGPQAATIYGSGAMGGVMQIFTKKGSRADRPDVTLSLKYGMLESNLGGGNTPKHDHALNVAGGAGPAFSYAASSSYNYLGAWQPELFARTFGASVGATHTRGALITSGTAAFTSSANGTAVGGGSSYCAFNEEPNRCYASLVNPVLATEGIVGATSNRLTQRVMTSSSQTLTLNVDYRPFPVWQHHVTIGRNQTNFEKVPEEVTYQTASDSLYKTTQSLGLRNSASYNTTFVPKLGMATSTVTVGANGSWGNQTMIDGCSATKRIGTIVSCFTSVNNVSVTHPPVPKNWGGFGSWQLGLWDRTFLSAGIRAEKNEGYGRDHQVDWTPTYGASYTHEQGDLTVKLLGSYGRATRVPNADYRLAVIQNRSDVIPNTYVYQRESPGLTPEYSSGPQGGIELYYGNLGSLTLNHYSQKVTNLIQFVIVDSTYLTLVSSGTSFYDFMWQYQNIGTLKQKGWEGTGSLNLGPLSLKGTYSWNDSRIQYRSGTFTRGQSFAYVPSHSGNVIASYAHRGTSLTMTSNWIGSSFQLGGRTIESMLWTNGRLTMYANRRLGAPSYSWAPGYVKTDLAVSQRVRPWASLTLNVQNLGNSYTSDMGELYPTLGRQTTFGVSLRPR